jgi:hypothetical protein
MEFEPIREWRKRAVTNQGKRVSLAGMERKTCVFMTRERVYQHPSRKIRRRASPCGRTLGIEERQSSMMRDHPVCVWACVSVFVLLACRESRGMYAFAEIPSGKGMTSCRLWRRGV